MNLMNNLIKSQKEIKTLTGIYKNCDIPEMEFLYNITELHHLLQCINILPLDTNEYIILNKHIVELTNLLHSKYDFLIERECENNDNN